MYGRVGVSVYTPFGEPTDGTLWIEVSRDNVEWSTIPRTFSATDTAQPHMWAIVEKYFRVRYVNGSTSASTFTLQTQYSVNDDILLGHQFDEVPLPEHEALNVKAVQWGTDPNGIYVPSPQSGVDDNNSSTTTLSGGSLTFTGTWSSVEGYHGLSVLVDGTATGTTSGTLQMQFSHDGSTVHRDIQVTTTDIANTNPRTLGVVAKYFRVIYTTDGDLTSFDLQTMLHTEQVSLVSRLDGTLQGNDDVSNVRSVLVGQNPSGDFNNISSVQTTNDAGTYNSLQVVSGAKPHELPGRIRVSEIITGVTGDFLQRTITAGKTFEVTDIILTVDNSDVNNTGRLNLRDGLTVTGTTVLPILVQESPNNETAVTVITHAFNEPLEFSEGLFIDIEAGTLTVTGTILGYEE
jgi:hypothetical protein